MSECVYDVAARVSMARLNFDFRRGFFNEL